MTDDIYETPSTTPDFKNELAAKLAELVPEAIADGKVDVVKLQELLASDATDGNERFGLFWPGKKRALRAAQEPTTATLKPDFENSKDWDTTKNVFIEGDNLEVLKILQKHYHGKVKLIYIDPPYNTGRDFVYPDNYKEGLDTYLEWTRQVNEEGKKVSTNAETEGRYHSNWLNMMYPRLKLARNLLTDDGVIFVSIDDNESANLRRLMDEVFGEGNFVATFKWNKTSKAPTLSKLVRNKYEYVLAYTRGGVEVLRGVDSYNTAAPLLNSGNPRTTLQFAPGTLGFRFPDDDFSPGLYGDADKGVELLDPLEVRGGKNNNEVRLRARFKWAQSTLDQRNSDGVEVYFKTPKLTTIYYSLDADAGKFIAPSDIVNDEEVGVKRNDEAYKALKDLFGGKVVFDYTKPVSLLKYLVRMIPDDSFIVLDFFSGAATTAHAVMELNSEDGGTRQHIQVQLPEPTLEGSDAGSLGFDTLSAVARERIRLAAREIAQEQSRRIESHELQLDLGFRAYRLSDTNFSKWRLSSDVEKDALQQHLLSLRDSSVDEATADDLLAETLLKQGYSLTEKLASADIGGLNVRVVGGNLVIAYLDEHTKPTLEQLRAIVDEEPARIIVLEDAFQGDDELKTNLAQLCKSKGVELWTA
jgi:adenine-specific DNA-methyltransferase